MGLELGTRLILRSASDGSPLGHQKVREICAIWAENVDVATADAAEGVGRSGGAVSSATKALRDGRVRWTLTHALKDGDDPSVEWRTEVVAVFDADRTTFAARLRRESIDYWLRPLGGSPKAPAVIRQIVEADGVECFDGPLRIDSRYRELTPGDVDGFIDTMLLAEDRRLPILAVAKSGARGRLDVSRLRRELAGFAHVWLVDADALPAIYEHLGNLSLDRNAARLWWAGLETDDDVRLYPHWIGPFEDAREVGDQIRGLVFAASRDRWREPTRVVEFERGERQERDDQGRAAVARLNEELRQLRASDSAATHDTSTLDAMASDLEQLEGDLQAARAAAEHAEEQWLQAEGERERLAKSNYGLRAQVDGLVTQLREARQTTDIAALTDDQLIEHEISAAWEATLTDHDREERPLRPFTVRDGFSASVDRVGADRGKAVEVAMQIACGLANELESRQPHPLRTSEAGGAPARTRATDGATAWRCYLQTKTPAARRMHYWVKNDGSIEFACVVTHDDMDIRSSAWTTSSCPPQGLSRISSFGRSMRSAVRPTARRSSRRRSSSDPSAMFSERFPHAPRGRMHNTPPSYTIGCHGR